MILRHGVLFEMIYHGGRSQGIEGGEDYKDKGGYKKHSVFVAVCFTLIICFGREWED